MPAVGEAEIKRYYAGKAIATKYVGDRFASELNRLLHARQVGAVQALLDRERPARVLEVAPGPGRLTRCVRPSGALVCVEFNEGMLAAAREACAPTTCRWVRGDAFRLPFEGAFDFVYTFRFLRHFRKPDRKRLYAELYRVLRPDGWLMFDAVNEAISLPLRKAHPEQYPVYDELYDERRLRRELTDAGFRVVELTPVQKNVAWQSASQNLLGPRSRLLNRMVVGLLEKLPRRAGLEWIVACRRA